MANKKVFKGFKQVTKTAFDELKESGLTEGVISFVQDKESEDTSIYVGSRRYALDTNKIDCGEY